MRKERNEYWNIEQKMPMWVVTNTGMRYSQPFNHGKLYIAHPWNHVLEFYIAHHPKPFSLL